MYDNCSSKLFHVLETAVGTDCLRDATASKGLAEIWNGSNLGFYEKIISVACAMRTRGDGHVLLIFHSWDDVVSLSSRVLNR